MIRLNWPPKKTKKQAKVYRIMEKSILPEDPNVICGYGPFSTSEKDPFNAACALHDEAYTTHMIDKNEVSQKAADLRLLIDMLEVAKKKKSTVLKLKAYLYYGIVRSVGWLFW